MSASDDMVREILVRLKDVSTLLRCAMVCKRWRSLIADDYFLRRCRCLPEEVCRSSAFSGFITQRNKCTGCARPCFVPAPGGRRRRQVLGNARRFLSSFFSRVPATYFDHAVPLASRHGLLLLRLELQNGCIYPDRSGVLLAVCDLLTGMVHELPGLQHYWDFEQGSKVTGYALVTAADCSGSNGDTQQQRSSSRYFKVLIVTIQHFKMQYNLHMFSSGEESRWNTCSGVVEDDEGHGISAMLRQHSAVVARGAAHWIMWGGTGTTYTLHVSVDTGRVSSTKMLGARDDDSRSKVYDKPYLTVDNEGNLMLLSLKRDGHQLEVSKSHDNGRSFQTSMLVLRQPPGKRRVDSTDHVYTCLGEKCGMMLVKVKNRRVYIADVKTGVMSEVLDWPCSNGLCCRKIVPLEIDWTLFFASRLSIPT